jgi:hypothetical protein
MTCMRGSGSTGVRQDLFWFVMGLPLARFPCLPASLPQVAIMAALPQHERIARMLGSVQLPDAGPCLVMAYYPHTLQVRSALRPRAALPLGPAVQLLLPAV